MHLRTRAAAQRGWISDPNCHLAEQRIVGVVEGEQEGGAMPAPAEGPAQGGAAEAIYDRRVGENG
jgi:hypothetical protein